MYKNDKKKKSKSPPFKSRLSQVIVENEKDPVLIKQSRNNIDSKFSKDNMIVAVRSRPLNEQELDFSNINVISISNREVVTVTEPLEYLPTENGDKYINGEKNLEIKKTKDYQFAFDFAFNENSSQEEIYLYTTEKLLLNVINGFNSTVFAYGATGSGKTYSMVGNGKEPGVMIRSISDLFKLVEKEGKNKSFNIKISYIEVYNEILRDLLSDLDTKKLLISEDPDKGVSVMGAKSIKVTNANDAFSLIVNGNKRRKEEPTEANANSSRSHAILQIIFEIEEGKQENQIAFGKFILVDLAGSEKISKTSKTSNNETASINKSLLALSDCIRILVSDSKKSKFIRWRDSKLTRILKDSLSGNCRIVMIATVSPSISAIEETLNTLQYANKAKSIKVKVTKNIIEQKPDPKFEEIINGLNFEINRVKLQLAERNKNKLPINVNLPDENSKNNNTISDSDLENYQKKIINHFNEEIKIRKDIIEKEAEIEKLKNKINNYQIEITQAENKKGNEAKKLSQLIQACKTEISTKTKTLSSIYSKQGQLVHKRTEIQKLVLKLTQQNNNGNNQNSINPLYESLSLIYRYYIAHLENLTSEHRKFINANDLARKDKLIACLTNQLDLRDKYILQAGNEIQKNNGTIDFKSDKLINADEIELLPYKANIVRVVPDLNNSKIASLKHLRNNSYNNNNNNNNTSFDNDRTLTTSNEDTIVRIRYGNGGNKNYENKFIITPKIVSAKRQIQNEIIPLFNENKKLPLIKKFQRVTSGKYRNNFINCNSSFQKGGKYLSPLKLYNNNFSNFNQKNLFNNNGRVNSQTLPYLQTIGNNYGSNRPISNTRLSPNKSSDSFNNSRFNNEVQRKVKTLISKNLIGRYRNSPYIQNNNMY